MYPVLSRIVKLLLLGGGSLLMSGCARSTVAVDGSSLEVTAAERPPAIEVQAQVLAAQAPVVAVEAFAFPQDKGGQALSQLLRPVDRLAVPLADLPPGPRFLAPPSGVEQPVLPLAAVSPAAPTLPSPLPVQVRPSAPVEEIPLTAYRNDPPPPARRFMLTGAALTLPQRDVRQPVDPGWLGLPQPDRVPLDDPTAEASLAAALASVPPSRMEPVPFVPQNLPDPFQYAQTVKLPTLPAEEQQPPAVTPQLPPVPPR